MLIVLALVALLLVAQSSPPPSEAAPWVAVAVALIGMTGTVVVTALQQRKTRVQVSATREENANQHGEVAAVVSREFGRFEEALDGLRDEVRSELGETKAKLTGLGDDLVNVRAGVRTLNARVDDMAKSSERLDESVRDVGRSVGDLRERFIDHLVDHSGGTPARRWFIRRRTSHPG